MSRPARSRPLSAPHPAAGSAAEQTHRADHGEALPPSDPGRSARAGRLLIAIAAGGEAVSNLVIMWAAAKILSVPENTAFLVFWSALFGLISTQIGLQNEIIRTTGARGGRGTRVAVIAALWSLTFLLLPLATAWLWAPRVLAGSSWIGVLTLVLAAACYPVFETVAGGLGGAKRWTWYGALLLTHVTLRMGLVLLVALLGAGLDGFEIAAAGAVAAVLLVLLIGRAPRRSLAARGDVGTGRLLRNSALAMFSTGCTALIHTAYPVLLHLTNPPHTLGLPALEATALTGACILAIQLTRAPIMMPLIAFQGVAISAFTEHRGSVGAAVRRPFLLLGAVGLLGAIAAWPIGPWVLRLFKPEYVLPGWYVSALTAASVLMACLTILGALALATNRHVLYVAGWLTASAVAIGCLLLPGSLLLVTTLSLVVGPATGAAVILLGLRRDGAADAADGSGAAQRGEP